MLLVRYTSGEAVERAIGAVRTKFGGRNAKLDTQLETLYENREKLCAYHITQFETWGKKASVLSEVFNSLVKGGNEFRYTRILLQYGLAKLANTCCSRILRANNYIQSLTHIMNLMMIYVDETVTRIIECHDKKRVISGWIRSKLEVSIQRVAKCLAPVPAKTCEDDEKEVWQVIEHVQAQPNLPAYDQVHKVSLCKRSNVATCNCPYFLSTTILCSGGATIGAMKSRHTLDSLVPMLHPRWLVKNHPLYDTAMATLPGESTSSACAQPLANTDSSSSALVVRGDSSIPSTPADRQAMLNHLYSALLPHTITSASLTTELHTFMLQHRAKCLGSTSLLLPPRIAITQAQVSAGAGPVAQVANQAASGYNRGSKKRKAIAQGKDPSCYSVHKQGATNADVTCLCGSVYVNQKHEAAKHRRSAVHKTWLAGYWASQAGQAGSSPVELRNHNSGDDPSSDDANGNEAPVSVTVADAPAQAAYQRGDGEADWFKMTFDEAAQALGLLQLDNNIVAWRRAHNFMRMPVQ